MPGSLYTDPDLIAADAQHSHRDVITDHQRFIYPSCQYQHCWRSLSRSHILLDMHDGIMRSVMQ